jgi:hypothetical protein
MDANPTFPLLAGAIAELGHIPPPPPGEDGTGPGGIASMSDPAKVHSLLTNAGFTDITIDEVDPEWVLHGFDELWVLPSELAGFGRVIKALGDGELQRVKDAIRAAAERFRDGDDYRLPAVAVCFIAR